MPETSVSDGLVLLTATNKTQSSLALPVASARYVSKLDPACTFHDVLTGEPQPLSLLLKACPLVDHLSLYDVVNTPGVTADLSHISTVARIEGFLPADDGMKKAFTGADMVVIPAGIPREYTSYIPLRRGQRRGKQEMVGGQQWQWRKSSSPVLQQTPQDQRW